MGISLDDLTHRFGTTFSRLPKRPRFRLGIRGLLIGGMAMVIVMLMIITTLVDIQRQRETEEEDLEQRALLLARSFNPLFIAPIRSGSTDDIGQFVSAIWAQPDVSYVKVFDRNAAYLYGPGRNQAQHGDVADASILEEVAGLQPRLSWSESGLRILAPVHTNELVGVVDFGFDTARIDDEIAALTKNRIWQTVALVGAGVALSYLVASYITEPIRLLRRATNRLARGELGTRIQRLRGLEMEELGASFNQMAAELEEKVEALEESRARIVSAQENVRRELAMHLHGPVQGQLLALKAQLENLALSKNISPETAAGLEDVAGSMSRVIQQEISALSRRLYPAIVRRGVVPALQSLCDQVEPLVELDLHLPDGFVSLERLNANLVPEEARLAAYRIAEEALANVIKHSHASRVSVSLEVQPDVLILSVKDNGRGFDPTNGRSGLGLPVMQDYAEANGGSCTIESRLGSGTIVTARLPISIELVSPLNDGNGNTPSADLDEISRDEPTHGQPMHSASPRERAPRP
jgi:signal transduction histidine kinase